MAAAAVQDRQSLLICTLLATISGTAAATAHSPIGWQFAAPAALFCLFYLAWRAPARQALIYGLGFGFAYFIAGLWWIYIALSGHVGLPAAGAFVLTVLMCFVLALFPALGMGLAALLAPRADMSRLLALAACWTLAEWCRSWMFTGFPWLMLGYSQIPDGWLAPWAPIVGVLGVTFALTLTVSALLTLLLLRERRLLAAGLLAVLFSVAPLVNNLWQWVTPAGTLQVSLLQGNVKQSLKWEPDIMRQALEDYMRLAKSSTGRVVILPETALPMPAHALPDGYLEALRAIAEERLGAVVAGVFVEEGDKIYNTAMLLQKDSTENYHKVHLTPYGEYLPYADFFAPLLGAAGIPYSGLSPGASPVPLKLPDNIHAAISICYEDIFGNEWRRQLPEAAFLINITNDGWFDGTPMPSQHLQMSQARALEGGRWLVRATNTGITAVVDEQGNIVSSLPQQVRGPLNEEIILHRGATLYTTFGDLTTVLIAGLFLLGGLIMRAVSQQRQRQRQQQLSAQPQQ